MKKVKGKYEAVDVADKGRKSLVEKTVTAVAALAIVGCLIHVPWKLTGRMYPSFSGTYKAITHSREVSTYNVDFDGEEMDLSSKISDTFKSNYGTIYNSYLAEMDGYELVKILVNPDTSMSVWEFMEYYDNNYLQDGEKIVSISFDNDEQQVFGIYREIEKVKTK